MKSSGEKSGLLLVIGIVIGVLGLTAGPALAALSFSSTTISGDGDGVTIGNENSTTTVMGNVFFNLSNGDAPPSQTVNITNDPPATPDDNTNLISIERVDTGNPQYAEPFNLSETWTPTAVNPYGVTLTESQVFLHVNGSADVQGLLTAYEGAVYNDGDVAATAPVRIFIARAAGPEGNFGGPFTGFYCDDYGADNIIATTRTCLETTQQPNDRAIWVHQGITELDGTLVADGNVGFGTSVPSTTVQIAGTLPTLRIGGSSLAGCLEVGNSNGSAGINYITVLNGVMTATTTKPSACQ